VSWYTPDELASYAATLWELDPVEVVARPRPTPRASVLPAIEANVFAEEGVDVGRVPRLPARRGAGAHRRRNVTLRDRADRQQPFNLRVPGGVTSIPAGGTIYDVAFLQLFQADALRGYGDPASPRGRRLLARPMHSGAVSQDAGAPDGGVTIAPDGSFAAFVPAQRALTWQLTDPDGAAWCASATGSASRPARSASARRAMASIAPAMAARPIRRTRPRRCTISRHVARREPRLARRPDRDARSDGDADRDRDPARLRERHPAHPGAAAHRRRAVHARAAWQRDRSQAVDRHRPGRERDARRRPGPARRSSSGR
jgi:hypothetical protein